MGELDDRLLPTWKRKELQQMLQGVLREAEESLRKALKERADFYARERVLESEQLILQARGLSNMDTVQAREILTQAKQKAAEAITVAIAQRLKLKREHGETVASYVRKLTELKQSLARIQKRISHANYLSLNQRIHIAEGELRKVRQALEREDFQEVGRLFENVQKIVNGIDELVLPLLERLSYETPLVNRSRNHRGKIVH